MHDGTAARLPGCMTAQLGDSRAAQGWHNCKMTGLQGGRVAEWQGCRVSQLQGARLQDGRAGGWKSCRTAGLQDRRAAGWQSCRLPRQKGCRVAQLCDSMAAGWQGCRVTQLQGGRFAGWQGDTAAGLQGGSRTGLCALSWLVLGGCAGAAWPILHGSFSTRGNNCTSATGDPFQFATRRFPREKRGGKITRRK